MSKELRLLSLRLAADKTLLRTAEFRGQKHLIVPVVALREGVIHAMNAEAPEFVPIEALERAPGSWNGRPIVPNHPIIDGEVVSANDPRLLEENSFGQVFATVVEGKKLNMEAWLDLARCASLGGDAQSVVDRCNAGEPVEVSVGAMVTLEAKTGVYKGKHYSKVWQDIFPDHLAMLPEGVKGACNNEMGCGAPRVASQRALTEAKITTPIYEMVEEEGESMSLKERVLSFLRSAAGTAQDVTDQDTRIALEQSLRAVEPGFMWVDFVLPDEAKVIYSVMPEDKWLTIRRGFSISTSKEITLADDRQEVVPVTRFEAASVAENKAACGCHNKPQGDSEMNKEQRIAALLAHKKGFFKDADKAFLEGLSEERLAEFETELNKEEKAAPKVEETAPVTEPEPKVAAAAPLTTEDWMKLAPASLRDMMKRAETQERAAKEKIVAKLKVAQQAYTPAELDVMPLEGLQKLAQALKLDEPVDYSAVRGAVSNEDDNTAPPPPDMNKAIRESRGMKTVN